MAAVEVEHLWKKFALDSYSPLRPRNLARRLLRRPDPRPEFMALKDVGFQVEPGEAFGIIGANGSGKSTLLKILCGILPATKGHARIHGSVSALIELGAGFHPDLSGRENVLLNASLLGFKRRDVLARMDEIIAFSELEPFIDQPVKRYSSGMYARLGFAVAAHVEAQVLLIDEVLAVGDIAFQEKCLASLAEQRARGATILFVSHDLNSVKGACNRVLWLHHGDAREIGDAGAVVRHYSEAMLPPADDLASLQPMHGTSTQGRPRRGAPTSVATSALSITRVTLMDERGEPTDRFHTGDRMIVQIDYVARRALQDLAFLCGIEDLNNFMCFGTSSRTDGMLIDVDEGPGSVRVTIERLNLHTGCYKITAAARHAETNLEYDILLNAALFQVRSGRPEYGTFHLDHTWEAPESHRRSGVQAFRRSGEH